MQVADELFYARGLHAVGIDEIIAKSGAAKATLYAHFPTKDDLIAAYLQQRSAAWRDYQRPPWGRGPGAEPEVHPNFILKGPGRHG